MSASEPPETIAVKPAAGKTKASSSMESSSTSTAVAAATNHQTDNASDSAPECRICLESDNQEDMVSPCSCQGTMQHAHLECLKHWCAEKKALTCELCNTEYHGPVKDKLASIVAAAQERETRQNFYTTYITLPLPSEGAPMGAASWPRFWCHVLLLTVLLIAVLYVALFVNIAGMDNFWVLFFWRILTVVLPLFLIGRTIIALHRWRRQAHAQRVLALRIARAQERRQQLQLRLQELSNLRDQGGARLAVPQASSRGGPQQQHPQQQTQHTIFIF